MVSNASGAERRNSATDMQDRLARFMRQSILPGDGPLGGRALNEAAGFLLETARQRAAAESAIAIASISEEHRFLRIAIVNDDMPFLVDSVAAAIAAQGLSISLLVHPILPVERDAGGRLVALGKAAAAKGTKESLIYIETERADARQRRQLTTRLRQTLGDVRAAVNDWPRLQAATLADAERLADPENAELLRWLNGGMLTQLGHLTRKRDGTLSEVLGICRKSTRQLLADSSYDRAFAWLEGKKPDGRPRELLIVKSNLSANVHRRVPLDLFIIPQRNARGRVEALSVHAGVWTSAALATPPDRVPRLRVALGNLNRQLGFSPTGHAGKALVHALTTLPHDLLIGFAQDDVARSQPR